MNNNPGNTDNNLNMTVLREYITMYLDDIESYGTEEVLNEATIVLNDFVLYVESMGVSISDDKWCHYSGMPSPNAYTKDNDEQAMIDYNAMEDESESNGIMGM